MAFLPTAHAEFERWQKAVTDWRRLPEVEQTQGALRNFASSRTAHAGDITQHSNMASGSGSTTSSAMSIGFENQMNDPNSAFSSFANNIFAAEWALYAPATTSVQDRADSLFNILTNESSRYQVGSLPLNTWLSRIAASTTIAM